MSEELQDLDLFWGLKQDVPVCCIDFYEMCWVHSIRKKIPEYRVNMWELSNKTGILLYPDCISKKIMVICNTHKIISK